jgi:hypothetical protein
MTVENKCPDCGKHAPLQAEATAGAAIKASADSPHFNSLKNLLVICVGVVLFALLSLALYRYLPQKEAGNTLPAQADKPAGQETAGKAASGTVPAASAAPDFIPLKRSLAEIEKRYGGKMQLDGTALIGPGPLEGGTIKTYRTGTGTDELTLKDEKLYKRTLAFNIAEIEGEVGEFCSFVYLLALHPTAYDTNYAQEAIPAEVRAKAEAFGLKCAELRAANGQATEQFEIDGGYAFGCINPDNTRLRFVVSSVGLFRAEKIREAARQLSDGGASR